MKIKNTTKNFLLKIEKYTGLDNIYFIKNSFYNIIQQIIGLICGLTITYFFGHYSNKILYGQYNLILSILGILVVVTLPGLDSALIKSIGSNFDGSFKKSVLTKIKLSSLIGIPTIIGFAIFYLLSKSQKEISHTLLILIPLFPLFYSLQLYNEFLTAKKKFKTLAIFSSVSSVISALTISLLIILKQNLSIILIGYFIAIILPSYLGYRYSLRYVQNNKINPELISYAVFLSLISVFPWISGYIGQIILGSLIGIESLAIYSAASGFPMSIQKNLFVFYKPITAKLASQTESEHKETLINHWWKLLILGIILFLFLWLLTPLLIKIFFPYGYYEAIKYARILSLGLIPLPLLWVISDIFIYQKKKQNQMILSIIPNSLKLLLFLVLIPSFGISGLVFTIVFDRFFLLILALFLLSFSKSL